MTADDRLAVIDLISDYAYRLEAGEVDAFAGNFTPDGVLEGFRRRSEGREEIRGYVRSLVQAKQDGPQGHRHLLGLPWIRGNGDHCQARTLFWIPGEPTRDTILIQSVGEYRDLLLKDDGRWFFKERKLSMFLRPSADN